MRRLIIANTYSQLLLGIQLKNTLFSNDKIVVLVSDHSNGAEYIVKNIKKLNIFEDCFYIKTKGLVINRNNISRIKDCYEIAFCNNNRYIYYIREIKNKWFDEIISYNFMIDIYAIYSLLSKINSNLMVSVYEEGILSYGGDIIETNRRKFINILRKLQEKEIISEHLFNFYCYYPSLYNGNLSPVQVPIITLKSKTAEDLKRLFKVDKLNINYNQKYIFFTSVYDFEGGKSVGEFELVKKIAKKVGMENLLIKMHPRDTRTIYTDNGFNVDTNSSIPWEVIQLSRDFSTKVYLTLSSVSVLSGLIISESPVTIYYMYKLCDYSGNYSCRKTIRNIENLLSDEKMKRKLKTVHIAEQLGDIV